MLMRSVAFVALVVAVVWLTGRAAAVRQQAVGVTGQLKCGDSPAANVRVKLFDEDSGPDPDDELAQGYTDSSGRFSLEGSTIELTNIDAVFKVYHDCDDGLMPGHRKVRFKIPNSYVTNGKTPKKRFNIGTINLETVFAEEQRETIVSRRRKRRVGGEWMPAMDEDFFRYF